MSGTQDCPKLESVPAANQLTGIVKEKTQLQIEARKAQQKAYRDKNPAKVKAWKKKSDKKHAEKIKIRRKAYYIKNAEKIKASRKKYVKTHKIEIKKYIKDHRFEINAYACQRRRANSNIRLSYNTGIAISMSLKGNKAGRHWEDLVGYTLNKLKKHLEKQFVEGMTWDNYGKWHVDHKTPISAFNFTQPNHQDFKRCWALKNLQPLWAKDNKTKNDRLENHFQPSLLI